MLNIFEEGNAKLGLSFKISLKSVFHEQAENESLVHETTNSKNCIHIVTFVFVTKVFCFICKSRGSNTSWTFAVCSLASPRKSFPHTASLFLAPRRSRVRMSRPQQPLLSQGKGPVDVGGR